ncbi:MAG: DUF1570 domain-containing protein [Planctomycetaceae bacterium]|nr:DUF1570 domain-containing protein [Planctomycetaceae bacterium]
MIVSFAVGDERASEPEPPPQPSAPRLEQVTFKDDAGIERKTAGRVLIEAVDGGLVVEGRDGRLWRAEKERLIAREPTGETFSPLSPAELGRQLAAELGGEVDVVTTKHYVICSRAGKAYTRWCGALFERLYAAFQRYWKNMGFEPHEPEFPLVALIFAHDRQFAEFATKDAGPDVATAKGYFSADTNRIVLYDLTATGQGGAGNDAEITKRLAAAPFNVATIVHEATHQIAFNSGMHVRYADNPLWLVEGMAMFFETPDLTSRTGWKTAGAVNDLRLGQFRKQLERRPADSLTTLIQSDARFTNPDQMGPAYAEAWALSYFLIKARKKAYVEYLNRLAAKPRLVFDDPATRLKDFRAAFGDDLQQLDQEFVKYVRKLK